MKRHCAAAASERSRPDATWRRGPSMAASENRGADVTWSRGSSAAASENRGANAARSRGPSAAASEDRGLDVPCSRVQRWLTRNLPIESLSALHNDMEFSGERSESAATTGY